MVITPKFNLVHEFIHLFMYLMYPFIVLLIFLDSVHFDSLSLEVSIVTEFIEIFSCRQLRQGAKVF